MSLFFSICIWFRRFRRLTRLCAENMEWTAAKTAAAMARLIIWLMMSFDMEDSNALRTR